jgi:hypothetical protein
MLSNSGDIDFIPWRSETRMLIQFDIQNSWKWLIIHVHHKLKQITIQYV